MLPAFFSVMLLIFIRSFESFEIPGAGRTSGDIRVLTTSIYLDAQKLPPQVWQRRRVFGAVDAGRRGDAVSLFSRHAGKEIVFRPLQGKDTVRH